MHFCERCFSCEKHRGLTRTNNCDNSSKMASFYNWLRSPVLIFLFVYCFVSSGTAKPITTDTNTGAMLYLSQYGWLDKSNIKPGSAALLDIRGAIRDFQSFAGINQTGDLDEETVRLMALPRCGVKDKIGHDAKRKKRYVLQGSRWKVNKLTYRITKYPSKLSRSDVDTEIDNAFKIWELNTNLTFEKATSGKVHIEVQFQKADHGDGDPFDGEGGTLAHAYFPVYGGDAHFDDEEKWTVKSYRGTNLFQVAAHEFGHSLGLSHSDVRTALMAPFYRGYQPAFKLDEDDVFAIQKLYGKKDAGIPTPPRRIPYRPTVSKPSVPPTAGSKTPISPSPSPVPKLPEICRDSKIDAITTMGDGATYVFKGPNYYRLTDTSIEDGYPKRIRDDFEIPGFLDAAFTWTNHKTYFFKGSQYWRFTDQKLDDGYPKDISDGFEGIPPNIDTAFVWSGNGKIYFFKGDKYYRFDPARRPPVAAGYPKQISNWVGLPNNIDAALQYSNGNTYFFKDDKYWRFNDRDFTVDAAKPGFPRSATTWWYGCGGDKGTSAMKNGGAGSEETVPSFYASDEDAGGGGGGSRGFSLVHSSFSHLPHLLLISLLVLYLPS